MRIDRGSKWTEMAAKVMQVNIHSDTSNRGKVTTIKRIPMTRSDSNANNLLKMVEEDTKSIAGNSRNTVQMIDVK